MKKSDHFFQTRPESESTVGKNQSKSNENRDQDVRLDDLGLARSRIVDEGPT